MNQEYKIEDIVTAIRDKEPIEVEKAFSDVLSSKLKDVLDTKKQELAKSVFSPELADTVEVESDEAVEEDIDFLEKVIKKKRRKGAEGEKLRKQARKDYKKLPKSKKRKRAKQQAKTAARNKGKNTVKVVGHFDPSEELDYGSNDDI